MTADVVLAVDPGERWTGIAARRGDELLDCSTVGRRPDRDDDDRDYVDRVLERIDALRAAHPDALADPLVAVEAVRPPTGWKGGRRTSVGPRVGWNVARTAIVYGAVLGVYPAAVVVPPGGHGSHPAGDYPAELVRRRPERLAPNDHPKGTRQHERSAWDLAGAALAAVRAAP